MHHDSSVSSSASADVFVSSPPVACLFRAGGISLFVSRILPVDHSARMDVCVYFVSPRCRMERSDLVAVLARIARIIARRRSSETARAAVARLVVRVWVGSGPSVPSGKSQTVSGYLSVSHRAVVDSGGGRSPRTEYSLAGFGIDVASGNAPSADRSGMAPRRGGRGGGGTLLALLGTMADRPRISRVGIMAASFTSSSRPNGGVVPESGVGAMDDTTSSVEQRGELP